MCIILRRVRTYKHDTGNRIDERTLVKHTLISAAEETEERGWQV